LNSRKSDHIDTQVEDERKKSESSLGRRSFPALQSFQFRDFRWLWLGTFIFFLAVMMQQITMGWLILRLTDDSPLALSLVMMAFGLPLTFASVLGGALADRFPRKHIIMISLSGNCILTLLLATLDVTGLIRFWHLMLLGFSNGTLAAFNMPSRQSLISDIVPETSLMNAISINSAGMNTARILGPAVAGILIIYMNTAGVFYLIALIHAFSALCMSMIGAGRKPADRSAKSLGMDIREGFRYALGESTLFGLLIMGLVPALFGFPYIALLPAWAREALNVQSDGLGLLMTSMGLGSVTGTLILASLRNIKRRGAFLLANSLIWGTCLILFSQSTSYTTAIPFLFLVGLMSGLFMSLNMTLMQFYSTTEMRGRIVSMAMMTFGMMPLSAVPFGLIAEKVGTSESLALSGLFLCLFTVAFRFAYPKFLKIA
jgi:MFS transporter, DHA1 family, staphyloferrin A biosynthesis exporter